MSENEKKKYDKVAYNTAYNKENYRDLKLHLKPDIYEKITAYCADMGISRTNLLTRAALYVIDNDMLDEIM